MRLYFLLCVVSIAGCSGKIYTVQNPEFIDGQVEGVIFHGYKYEDVSVKYDRIRNVKTGEITHSSYEDKDSPRYCVEKLVQIPVVKADYSTRYAIRYEAAIFETNKFSVELEKGTLKAVNTEATPGAVESLQALADLREDIMNGIDPSVSLNLSSGMKPIPCSTNK